jgi:hypothetical protein
VHESNVGADVHIGPRCNGTHSHWISAESLYSSERADVGIGPYNKLFLIVKVIFGFDYSANIPVRDQVVAPVMVMF